MLKYPRLRKSDSFVPIWFVALNVIVFLAFGFDKWRASRSGHRVSEFVLVMLGALAVGSVACWA
jgi:uncharacterized membrane protein YsdA (DUF1294 family)